MSPCEQVTEDLAAIVEAVRTAPNHQGDITVADLARYSAKEREPVDVLRPPAGEVAVRVQGGLTFVAARPEWGPPWKLFQLQDSLAVEEAPHA